MEIDNYIAEPASFFMLNADMYGLDVSDLQLLFIKLMGHIQKNNCSELIKEINEDEINFTKEEIRFIKDCSSCAKHKLNKQDG